MKESGQSLHEYAIAIALLAVAAIGALNLLGGNLNTLLGQFNSGSNQSEAGQLYALIDTPIDGSGISASRTAATANSARDLLIRIDPSTGKMRITETNSDGTNSTSIDGGEVISASSMALAQLANSKTGTGEDLPQDIQLMIRQLAGNGTQLGELYNPLKRQQQDFFAVNKQIEQQAQAGKYGGPPYYDASFVGSMIQNADQYIQLSQTYKKLDQRLGELAQTDASMAALQDQVNGYAGAITGINLSTIGVPTFGQFSIDNVRQEDLMASLSKAPSAMSLFAPVAAQAQSMTPEMRKTLFQKSFVGLGQQMLSGKRIDSPEGVSISLPGVSTATADGTH